MGELPAWYCISVAVTPGFARSWALALDKAKAKGRVASIVNPVLRHVAKLIFPILPPDRLFMSQ
jgi:hypothetical protein